MTRDFRSTSQRRRGVSLSGSALVGGIALAFAMPCATRAGEPPAIDVSVAQAASAPDATRKPEASSGEFGAYRNHWLPLAEIIAFDFLLNRYNRGFSGSSEYAVTGSSIRRNLRGPWVADNDPFKVNQFLHPYQGSMYHGFARSTGHDFWESLGYTFLGSALWEIAGENTPPAKNDQVASGIAGSFLGESLFRMANLMLERGRMSPFWREVAAGALAPSMGFNRYLFGEKFSAVFPSNDPAYYSRLQLGASGLTQDRSGTSTNRRRSEVLADFSMDYGLPGKPGYTYRRPFDHFTFQATGSSANVFENIMTRGLLIGRPYEAGENYRGVWGLYGGYDYLAPQVYRFSSTALSLGTTGQWWLSDTVAIQGTALAGVGYAGASTLGGASTPGGANERDYHYGVAPQAMVAARWIYGDRFCTDVSLREYFVSGVHTSRGGHDNIVRADASFTWRITGQHAIAIKYLYNRRDARFVDLGDRKQSRGTVGIFYALLGQERFGVVDWRP